MEQLATSNGELGGGDRFLPEADQLREFCHALLEFLDTSNPHGSLSNTLSAELVRAIGASVGEVADGLRGEMIAWDTAIRSLQTLPSRFFSPTPAVSSLLSELETSRASASRVAGALETLRGVALTPPEFRKSQEEVSSHTSVVRTPISDAPCLPTRNVQPARPITLAPIPISKRDVPCILQADDTAELLPLIPQHSPQRKETENAAQVFAKAEEYRRQRDFNTAEEFYTQAIQFDPRFGPAYSRRGQVRLAWGDIAAAIADFDTALYLDDTAAEAWWWRGDAHVVAERIDEAIADYTRALELRPNLTRAQFNLGVALRQKGELDEAMKAFTQLIERRPNHAAAYLNRGLIHLQRDERERATVEFRTALQYDPGCEQARQQLDSVLLTSPKPFSVDGHPIEKRVAAVGVIYPSPGKSLVPETRKGEGKHPPHTQASQMKREGVVAVNCPKCGELGEVPWDRLNKVFFCRACKGRFGIKADGKTVELIHTSDGKWVELPRLSESARKRRKRRVMAAVLGLIVLLPTMAIGGWHALKPPPEPTERELPHDLTARIELFTQAWLCNDTRLLQRLTSPAHDKVVFSWYTRHRPPVALRSAVDGTPPEDAKIEITIVAGKSGQSMARVYVGNPVSAPSHPPAELNLAWAQQGEDWYFLPPSR